ncbi:DNA cytosine methyltransferase [Curtobacterium flaccumfaciens]|uniref:DNA cytosine methyltransferase n=1 Tax=Curtobacterium flaccumfaciens TaxID=2035 RepID=UPI001BDF36F1|nr:DNA cytosine methyltransferase [Curtobacterium flaccumfaciens]MBT1630453.1 DNA cytosine methyltransferase [Curtobacterium flaccumfaciens pv. oortii]MCX2843932.1 DNA cytosine methyltransferase [Curtobacterium flaccumfaciens pv. oortii]
MRKVLDLFCCAGGAAKGYHDAGFEVVGVDIDPQPRYPYEFVQADALEYLAENWHRFDFIHASPPCQAYSDMKHMPDAKAHPELIEPTRALLQQTDKLWVIENVVGAPMIDPVVLCGSMFGLGAAGYSLQRHRQFEANFPILLPSAHDHSKPTIGVYGGHVRCRSAKHGFRGSTVDFPGMDKKALAQEAMGIDWMTMNQMSEAIPPAYTRWIGEYAKMQMPSALHELVELVS